MSLFICPACKAEKEAKRFSVKIIDGKAQSDVQCDECDSYMEIKTAKTGFPNFTSNQYGQL